MMGGALPGVLGWLPALILATLVGLALLRRHSLAGALATALCGQWLVHELAVLGSPYSASGGHHAHHGAVAWQPTILDEAPMALGHLVAAVLTALAILAAARIREAGSRLKVMLGQWAHSLVQRAGLAPPVLQAPRLRPARYVPDLAQAVFRLTGYGLRAPPVSLR